MRACITVSLISFIAGLGLAFALGSASSAPTAVNAAIVADEQASVIRFFIDGQEKARLDAAGLHVRDDLNYGGALTDYGQAGFEGRARAGEYEGLSAGDGDAQ